MTGCDGSLRTARPRAVLSVESASSHDRSQPFGANRSLYGIARNCCHVPKRKQVFVKRESGGSVDCGKILAQQLSHEAKAPAHGKKGNVAVERPQFEVAAEQDEGGANDAQKHMNSEPGAQSAEASQGLHPF